MVYKYGWLSSLRVSAALLCVVVASLAGAASVTLDNGGYCATYTAIAVDASGNLAVTGCSGVTPGGTLVSIGAVTAVNEGAIAVVTITRSGGDLSSALAVKLEANGGTAVSGTDYTAWSTQATLPANATSVSFSIQTLRNTASTSDQTLSLKLALVGTPANTQLGVSTATLTIKNIDGGGGSCPATTATQAVWGNYMKNGSGTTMGYSGATFPNSPTQSNPLALQFTTESAAVASGSISYAPNATSNYNFVDIAVSKCPGDFNSYVPSALCKVSMSKSGSILFTVGAGNAFFYCKLEPSTTYYLNIQPSQAGAISEIITRY